MTYHIHQNMRKRWVVRRTGALRALKTFPTLTGAIRHGRTLIAGDDELLVHDRAGLVQRVIRP